MLSFHLQQISTASKSRIKKEEASYLRLIDTKQKKLDVNAVF